jgi:microsomal dipeptidase-like Zn-dependent dipeptidase
VAARKVAIVLCVEGAHMVREPSDVDRLWDAGIRLMTLTHFTNNGIAGAAFSTLSHPENFHYFGHHSREEGVALNRVGLTALGKQVVLRMAERGMIVDLAHASDAAVKDVLALTADHPVPLVITHTALRAYHPAERNESDELIRAVAGRGGVIGLTTWRIELDAEGFDECQAFAAHFRRLLELVGPEHVGIGTDFNGMVMRTRGCGKGGEGILRTGVRNVGDMPQLLQSLVEGGVPPHVLESMGANMLRVMDDAQRLAHDQTPGAAGKSPPP